MSMKHRFIFPDIRRRRRRRRQALVALSVLAVLAFLLFWGPEYEPSASPEETAAVETESDAGSVAEAAESEEAQADDVPRDLALDGVVQPGETFSSLLREYLSPQQISDLAARSRKVFPLSQLRAGQSYSLALQDDSLVSFIYDIDRDHQLSIRCEGEGCDVDRVPIPYTVQTETLQGTISSSLFEAVAESNESAELAVALADIFAWDIDFIRDIKEGDAFSALVEKRYRDGQAAGYGRILAAEFNNQGRSYQAILFQDGDNPPQYYTPDGQGMRKAFLKAPLNFSRISSGFTKKRFHPVLRVWRPHLAIDYAAPTGTPVRTVADGSVVKKSYDRSNGNLVRVRHANGYETTYIHLSKFAKGLKVGKRLKQGDLIGYVGSTGIATGPHLDFRMFKNGRPINPTTVKSTTADPVSKKNLVAFQAEAVRLLAELDGGNIQQARVAAEEEKKLTP
ncbi:peptidoglycan DD-metalloendopeptidase family protein [Trichloromonas sp.]|uniref:M23 family metallopeptidase n=1 Tax=Trichloromonas sp. TaxID=3069249 RepID=UPI002A4A9B59|nr:peptidoglycan DD-metalloendopeptidase family protein [Trichloromonas sp.]